VPKVTIIEAKAGNPVNVASTALPAGPWAGFNAIDGLAGVGVDVGVGVGVTVGVGVGVGPGEFGTV
jgi:hypothetical protein